MPPVAPCHPTCCSSAAPTGLRRGSSRPRRRGDRRPRAGQLSAGAAGPTRPRWCPARDLHGLFLTHIHLDHGGAAGTIVREYPHVKVYVHDRGAPHLSDPARLLASATRLYGDQMDRLWGEFAAVPAANLVVPADGGVLDLGGALFDVAYTPGPRLPPRVLSRPPAQGRVCGRHGRHPGGSEPVRAAAHAAARHRRASLAGEPRAASRVGAHGRVPSRTSACTGTRARTSTRSAVNSTPGTNWPAPSSPANPRTRGCLGSWRRCANA